MIRWFRHFLPITGDPKTHVVICYDFGMHPPMPDEAVITGDLKWTPSANSIGFELTVATPCITIAIPTNGAGGIVHETTTPRGSDDDIFLVP